MYDKTPKQVKAEIELNKQGYEFSNWIEARDDDEDHGCMVMVKRITKGRTEYREIDPEGSIN